MFSIIIPFLDRIELLCETIQYFKKQTYKDWELILVDDGSCEKGLEKVFLFIETDKHIRYLKRPESVPEGGNGARNYGMEQAQNDWIIFYDSDDILLPDGLVERKKVIDKNNSTDLFIFKTGFFDQKNNKYNNNYKMPDSVEKLVDAFLNREVYFQTGSMVWKNSFVKEIKGWNNTLRCFQDFDIFLRASNSTRNIWVDSSNEIFHYYRINAAHSIASAYKTKTYKLHAFTASLQIEHYVSSKRMNNFKIFVKNYFVEWSVLHLGFAFPLHFVLKNPFYKNISKIVF